MELSGAEIKYNVKMANVNDSKMIRKKFGSFFLGSKDGRPPSLTGINIKNRTTPETKTRVELLKLMAKRYRESNSDGRAQVNCLFYRKSASHSRYRFFVFGFEDVSAGVFINSVLYFNFNCLSYFRCF